MLWNKTLSYFRSLSHSRAWKRRLVKYCGLHISLLPKFMIVFVESSLLHHFGLFCFFVCKYPAMRRPNLPRILIVLCIYFGLELRVRVYFLGVINSRCVANGFGPENIRILGSFHILIITV